MKIKRVSGMAAIAMGAVAAVALLTGCTQQSIQNDKNTTDSQLLKYQQAQPVPQFDFSQYRQTVINVETAEANGVARRPSCTTWGRLFRSARVRQSATRSRPPPS